MLPPPDPVGHRRAGSARLDERNTTSEKSDHPYYREPTALQLRPPLTIGNPSRTESGGFSACRSWPRHWAGRCENPPAPHGGVQFFLGGPRNVRPDNPACCARFRRASSTCGPCRDVRRSSASAFGLDKAIAGPANAYARMPAERA